MTVKSILSAAKNPENNESLDIVPNFGEKTLLQIFRDVKEGEIVNMEIEGFKA